MAVDDLQWAAFELKRRRDRAQTPEDRATVTSEIARARADPAFRARLAQIAQQGKWSSGLPLMAKLGLAAGTLATPLFPPLGIASTAGLAGLAIPTGLEAMQRRSEGLPWKWQAAESALDLAAPGIGKGLSKVGGLLRGINRVPPAPPPPAWHRFPEPPPSYWGRPAAGTVPVMGESVPANPHLTSILNPMTGRPYTVFGLKRAQERAMPSGQAVAEESLRREENIARAARVNTPSQPLLPTFAESLGGKPAPYYSTPDDIFYAPGAPMSRAEDVSATMRAQGVHPEQLSMPQLTESWLARVRAPLPHTVPTMGRSVPATPGIGYPPAVHRNAPGSVPIEVRPTNPRTGRPYTEFELRNLRRPYEPRRATPAADPQGGPQPTSPQTPTGTPPANPSEADAAVAVAKSPARAADEVLSAMEADVDKLTGVTDHQAAFLRSFLGQIDDFGEPVLQRLRAGDVPAQEIVFDRVLRFIDQQRLGPGVKPRERAAIGHLYASGGLGGGMSKNVPGLPSGWLAASPGRVMKTTKEGRELRGTFPGMENVSVGAAGQPVPHFTALTELPIGKNKASDVYRKTVRASKAGTEEWDDVERAVRESAKESGVSISNDQVALVTAFRVAYDRFDAVYKYIKHAVGAPHRRVPDPATGKYVNVKAYHPIWKQSHKTGDQRTAMGDMRSVMKRVASGEWDASKIQTIINQLNRQALQVLGVIGSVEMARRALAPEQTPNAPLT